MSKQKQRDQRKQPEAPAIEAPSADAPSEKIEDRPDTIMIPGIGEMPATTNLPLYPVF